MTSPQFSELKYLKMKEAWPFEANNFTPWLSENLDKITKATGIPLRLLKTEVGVESFCADIHAINEHDDTNVVIENQFGKGDHKHLGQCLTYLAGLDAKIVIWIAEDFEAAHLSTVRWFNAHTKDDISFFAIRAGVAKIDNSPFAPIFEVIEQPDYWARKMFSVSGERARRGDLSPFREPLWLRFAEKFPALNLQEEGIYRYIYLNEDYELYLSFAVRRNKIDFGIRSDQDLSRDELFDLINEAAPAFETNLGPIRATHGGYAFNKSARLDLFDENTWDDAIASIGKMATDVVAEFKIGPDSK